MRHPHLKASPSGIAEPKAKQSLQKFIHTDSGLLSGIADPKTKQSLLKSYQSYFQLIFSMEICNFGQ